MNVEAAVIAYLSQWYECSADVPSPRPDELVTVERTGGALDCARRDRAQIAVQCWGQTREGAALLADGVRDKMRRLALERGIAKAEVNSGPYNYPAEKGEPRYQITYDITAYAY